MSEVTSVLAATAVLPPGRIRPGDRRCRPSVGDRGQVDADRAAADGPHDERDGQCDQLLVLLGEGAQPLGHVHVGGVEHAGLVEGAEQAVGAAGEPRVVRVLDLEV